jgi:hypothetical protein
MFATTRRFAAPLVALLAFAAAQSALASPFNPPPLKKLEGYSGYELRPVGVDSAVGPRLHLDRAVAQVDSSVRRKLYPILQEWNAFANHKARQRLLIEPRITEIRKLSKAGRIFGGALAGDSYITMRVRITELPSGRLIAEPEFYRRTSAMAGAWTMGHRDNVMIDNVAGMVASYVNANYTQLVGGDTGY